MYSHFVTADSFGSMCPSNWEAIADAMNNIINARGIEYDHEAVCELWEDYNNGKLQEVPAAVFDD